MNNTFIRPIRTLIVDDQTLFRVGLRNTLSAFNDLHIVGEASSAEDALEQVRANTPDVILMNLTMPEMDGIQTTREITKHNPSAKVIILTASIAGDRVWEAVKSGAKGYLLKDSSVEELYSAILSVHQGESAFSPNIAMEALVNLASGDNTKPILNPLTKREMDILKLVATGKSNNSIAEILNISSATVNTHMNNILSKIGAKNRVQATLYALRHGMVELSGDNSE